MPSRRHGSAMLSSPRSPSSTTRIFSSAQKCRRVARRMSLIASSAGCFSGPDFCLIFAPGGYDDPEILPTRKPPTVSKALTADSIFLSEVSDPVDSDVMEIVADREENRGEGFRVLRPDLAWVWWIVSRSTSIRL